jgi:hypothetical protein
VGRGARAQLLRGFREGDVEHTLAAFGCGHQELERQRGLARTGHPFDQEETLLGESTSHHVVEAGYSRGQRISRGF